MASFVIRNLVRDDIPALLKLPQAEGREMGLESELETWLKVDPHGIFIAVSIEDGQIVGCCSAMILSESHGYVGMYIVSKRHRGGGLGRILWKAAVSHLGDRNMCLSAVEMMTQCYRDKAGFTVVANWTVDLYFGTCLTLPSTNHYHGSLSSSPVRTLVVEPNGPLSPHVVRYDQSIHGYDRSVIVASTLEELGTMTLVAIGNLLDGCPAIVGYACMKKSLQGHWLIAPLYADDYDVAYSLMYGLIGSLTEQQRQEGIVAKLMSSNTEAAKLFHAFGLRKTKYQLQRLFTQFVVDVPVSRIFALQSSIFCTE